MAYSIYSKAGTDEAISSALAGSLPDLTDYVQTTDDRLGDARTPTAHAASHKTAGADALTAADIGAQPAGNYAAASHAHAPTDIGAATAAQGALADATTVEQVTLTAPLAYTLPVGTPAGVVHRVVFTQDGTGGHTVTYGGSPVTVGTTAGASTLVELWPNGTAARAVVYPAAEPDAAWWAAWQAMASGTYLVPDPANVGLYLPTAGSAMVEDPTHDGLYTIGPLA